MMALQKNLERAKIDIERNSLPAKAVAQLQEQKITLGKAFTPEQELMLLRNRQELDTLIKKVEDSFLNQFREYLPSSGGSAKVTGVSPSK